MDVTQIYLASASPRRRELLAQIGIGFELLQVEVDESPQINETPDNYVRRLALAKAQAGYANLQGRRLKPVLGADTAVVLEGDILGKPQDQQAAQAMLSRLSGKTHTVMSAVAMVAESQIVYLNQSQVSFREISAQEIAAYWRTGEPADKAGAYGIQGLGAVFVSHLEGSYSGVMGLPLFETARLLREFGVEVPGPGLAGDVAG